MKADGARSLLEKKSKYSQRMMEHRVHCLKEKQALLANLTSTENLVKRSKSPKISKELSKIVSKKNVKEKYRVLLERSLSKQQLK